MKVISQWLHRTASFPRLLLQTLPLLLVSVSGVADDGGQAGRWYLNPAVGVQGFDGDRALEDETATGLLGLEYRFDEHWATELRYLRSSPDVDPGRGDIDLDQLFLDGLYYLGVYNGFEPYLAVGVGHARFDTARKNEETQLNAGGGVRFHFNRNWSARADLRAVNGLDSENTDSVVSLGVSYAFGGGAAAPAETTPRDSDGDGVADTRDRCPETPAGVAVDSDGCALDGDGDGVADYRDECPRTPAGREVDEVGCKFVLTETVEVTLRINFPVDSHEVPVSFMGEVERAGEFLRRYAEVDAIIEGHTDSTGAAAYNQKLSQRRAEAVRQLLIERYGIDGARLSARGYGEERPIASNETEEGRLSNRRVVAVMKAQTTEE